MSVITSWSATPNRLKIALRFVSTYGPAGAPNEVLQQTLLPGALARTQADDEETQGGSAIGNEVLTELRNLGMLERADDGSLSVSSSLTDLSDEAFLEHLQAKLLNPVEASKHSQEAFPKALSWFLCQDPATPLSWGYNYRELVDEDCGPENGGFELRNESGCEQFVYWARFLGFAWRLNVGGRNSVIPDPTKSIARTMRNWGDSESSDWQPIGEILGKLSVDLPVLEGGSARTEIESKFAPVKRRPEEHISRSTSFSLRRLERSGRIEMNRLADATAMNLDFGSELRPVSHVKWTGLFGD